jgi:hypothetical protein
MPGRSDIEAFKRVVRDGFAAGDVIARSRQDDVTRRIVKVLLHRGERDEALWKRMEADAALDVRVALSTRTRPPELAAAFAAATLQVWLEVCARDVLTVASETSSAVRAAAAKLGAGELVVAAAEGVPHG